MKRMRFAAIAMTVLATGCATQIHPVDAPVRPAKVKLSGFQSVTLRPLAVAKMEGDSGDLAAVARIENELQTCTMKILPQTKVGVAADSPTSGLVIEPTILDLKKVNGAERFWAGALAGSSAVLLKVKYTDAATKELVADPTFYAKANAMGGAWTFGATDNAMLSRVVENACEYLTQNY